MAGLWVSAVTLAPVGIFAIPLLIFIAWDLRKQTPPIGSGTLKATRLATGQKALRGEPFKVELSLENLGPDIKALLVRDLPPRQAQLVRGSTVMLCSLKHAEKVSMRYEVVFDEPGEFTFSHSMVTSASAFGLSEKSAGLEAPLLVRVYPRRAERAAQPVRARAFGWTGSTASKYRGGRVEFMDIRAYTPGDPLRAVNWKASAKTGKVLVNEWQADRGLDCVIVVDLSPRFLPKVGEWSARTSVVGASYELAGSLLMAGNRVGMLIMGDVLHKIRPGFGSRHLRKMVDYLVVAREGRVWSLEYAENFLELFYRRQYSSRGGTLFFVMAGPDEQALGTVAALSSRGFVCNSVLVNTLAEESSSLQKGKLLDARQLAFGERLARAEMEAYKGAFARVSDVYEWSEERGFSEVLRRMGR